jgi:hypothetical protein
MWNGGGCKEVVEARRNLCSEVDLIMGVKKVCDGTRRLGLSVKKLGALNLLE